MSWRTEVGNYVLGYDPGDDRSASACVVVMRKKDDDTMTAVGDVTGEAARLIGDYVSALEAENEWLRTHWRALHDEVQRSEAWRVHTGMKPATDTSEFASAPPSVLRAIARRVRAALGPKGG